MLSNLQATAHFDHTHTPNKCQAVENDHRFRKVLDGRYQILQTIGDGRFAK